jgi:hypothetical protein
MMYSVSEGVVIGCLYNLTPFVRDHKLETVFRFVLLRGLAIQGREGHRRFFERQPVNC